MELEKIRNLSDEELKSSRPGRRAALPHPLPEVARQRRGLKKLRTLKLDIARIKTVARQRTLAAEKAANPVVANVAPAKSTRTARKKAKKD